jgi:acyl-coenzyme A thioesterase PaaI-like protein
MSFDVPRFCARYLAEDHNALMGLHYLAHEPGCLELELPYNADLARGDGNAAMADGAIMALLDMAGTIAVWSRIDQFRPHATIDLRIDHLQVPPAASIRCAVECFHVDTELARVRGSAFADGRPVATIAATYAFTGTR